jgi:hypothetical protein
MSCASLVRPPNRVNRPPVAARGHANLSATERDETVSLRVLGAAPATAVAEPVLLALGARAGLDVSRLDELAMAFGLAVRGAGRPLVIELTPAPGVLTIVVRPVEPSGLAECREVLDRLVGAVEVEGDGRGLVLRAG